MASHILEVADILRAHGAAFLRCFPTSSLQRSILRRLVACRTSALGGQVFRCDACGHSSIRYHSCRDRHCPKCQAAARADWFEARARDLLPVSYFHVVFTLPEELRPLALQNKKAIYGLLLRTGAETLLQVAADPRQLGARIGFHAILHTWSQTLLHHPHIHCVIPGGGLSPDGSAWVHSRKNFFLPVSVLRLVFRGKFLDGLRRLFDAGELKFHGKLVRLAESARFSRLLKPLGRKKWMVYVKPPFGGPERVLKYLARYTHRIAISNSRLRQLHGGQVTFSWKDYRDQSRRKTMTITVYEFIRRFLLHVLPRGFVRIRHYGFLANRVRRINITLCRQLLDAETVTGASPDPTDDTEPSASDNDPSPLRCPACRQRCLLLVGELLPDTTPQLPHPQTIRAPP